jgi:hypothetical protein
MCLSLPEWSTFWCFTLFAQPCPQKSGWDKKLLETDALAYFAGSGMTKKSFIKLTNTDIFKIPGCYSQMFLKAPVQGCLVLSSEVM